MAITYTYEIHDLKIEPTLGSLDKVVVAVAYSYVGTNENQIKASFPGITELPEPNSQAFIPIEELTPEVVVEWIEANTSLEPMQLSIQGTIEQQSNAILKGSTLPWAPIIETVASGSVSGSI
jgi:hypothetical protein